MWFEINRGTNLWSSFLHAQNSQCRSMKLSQRQYKRQFIWSGLQILYLVHMNLTAQQNQHQVNRHNGTVSFSTVCSYLHSSWWCPRRGHMVGAGQCSMARTSVDDILLPCFEFLPHGCELTSRWGGQKPPSAFIPSHTGANFLGTKTTLFTLVLCCLVFQQQHLLALVSCNHIESSSSLNYIVLKVTDVSASFWF